MCDEQRPPTSRYRYATHSCQGGYQDQDQSTLSCHVRTIPARPDPQNPLPSLLSLTSYANQCPHASSKHSTPNLSALLNTSTLSLPLKSGADRSFSMSLAYCAVIVRMYHCVNASSLLLVLGCVAGCAGSGGGISVGAGGGGGDGDGEDVGDGDADTGDGDGASMADGAACADSS